MSEKSGTMVVKWIDPKERLPVGDHEVLIRIKLDIGGKKWIVRSVADYTEDTGCFSTDHEEFGIKESAGYVDGWIDLDDLD